MLAENPSSMCSNNTNKFSPQEQGTSMMYSPLVQIIQINLVLKNLRRFLFSVQIVQIIQINLVLKNSCQIQRRSFSVQIIQINLVLKNPDCFIVYHYSVQIIQINLVLKNLIHQTYCIYQFK